MTTQQEFMLLFSRPPGAGQTAGLPHRCEQYPGWEDKYIRHQQQTVNGNLLLKAGRLAEAESTPGLCQVPATGDLIAVRHTLSMNLSNPIV